MSPIDVSALSVSYDGTCGPDKGTKCSSGCCSQYGNCGTSREHCSGACQHAFGTGCLDADVAGSWQKAADNGVTDEEAGGQYYFDAENKLFWTWDTLELISRKFEEIVRRYQLGGVMAWSLGEDSYDWSHVRRMAGEVAKGGYAQATGGSPVELASLDNSTVPDAPTSSSAAPYDVVWVDGTEQGPEGDYAEMPASPSDYTVNYDDTRGEEVSTASTATPSSAPSILEPDVPAPIEPTTPAQSSTAPLPPSATSEAPFEYTRAASAPSSEASPEIWEPAVSASLDPPIDDYDYVYEPNAEPQPVLPAPTLNDYIFTYDPTAKSAIAQPSILPAPFSVDKPPYIPPFHESSTINPATLSTPTSHVSGDWVIDSSFTSDEGHVNPNWPPVGVTASPPTEQSVWGA
jgi:hypothetical protein